MGLWYQYAWSQWFGRLWCPSLCLKGAGIRSWLGDPRKRTGLRVLYWRSSCCIPIAGFCSCKCPISRSTQCRGETCLGRVPRLKLVYFGFAVSGISIRISTGLRRIRKLPTLYHWESTHFSHRLLLKGGRLYQILGNNSLNSKQRCLIQCSRW